MGINDDEYGLPVVSDNDFEELFKTESIKVFTDIVFVNNLQHLVVKTW
jgi:hypothetical protein